MEEREALRRANEKFYLALEGRDLPAMDELWLHESWVQCVHPGWEALVGWPNVRRSFEEMFGSTRGLRVTPTAVRELVLPGLAVVSCAENLTIGSGDDLDLAVAQATNLFLRTPAGWKMVHHHASSAPVRVTQPFTGTVQ
jgi:ketosteroid isomerase-like protein